MLLNHGRSTKIKEKWWNEHSLHKSSASGRHDAALLNHSQWIWSRAEDGTRDVPRGMKGSDSHAQTHVYEQGHTCSCQCGLYSRLKNIKIFEDTSNTHTHTHTHTLRDLCFCSASADSVSVLGDFQVLPWCVLCPALCQTGSIIFTAWPPPSAQQYQCVLSALF